MVNLNAPKKERLPNQWVLHVKEYAKNRGLKYHEALRSVECKQLYYNRIITLKKNKSSVKYENKKHTKWYKRIFSCVSI
jgi:hypothetical protein